MYTLLEIRRAVVRGCSRVDFSETLYIYAIFSRFSCRCIIKNVDISVPIPLLLLSQMKARNIAYTLRHQSADCLFTQS